MLPSGGVSGTPYRPISIQEGALLLDQVVYPPMKGRHHVDSNALHEVRVIPVDRIRSRSLGARGAGTRTVNGFSEADLWARLPMQ
jgi:hypothetical protein